MRKVMILLVLLLCVGIMAACGQVGGYPPSSEELPDAGMVSNEGSIWEAEAKLLCRIVDGAEEGALLLAEQGENTYGVYRVNAANLPVKLDGKAATAADLQDGMLVEVYHGGMVQETFPAQFADIVGLSARSSADGELTDLCGLYLQVLEDLWTVDAGLNSESLIIGLDFSSAPGNLTAAEQSALIWRFGELHGASTVTGTWEELVEQGYIAATPLGDDAPEGAKFYEWRDGIHFSISADEDHPVETSGQPAVFFNAKKWRSSLGAYYFADCAAVWPETGPWTDYTVGSEVIA